MFERYSRLVLASVMSVTLFLPNTGEPNWFFIFWSSGLYLAGVTSALHSIGGIIFWLGTMLFLLAVPILILLNALLVLADFLVRLKTLYRISLLILFPLTWWGTLLRWSGGSWGVGFWAIPAVVTAATLTETAFLVGGRLRKSQNARSVPE